MNDVDLNIETGQETLDEDDGNDVLHISVSVIELDGRWQNASAAIPADLVTVDGIAECLIQSILGAACARSPQTLMALQMRLLSWGTE